MTLAGKRAPGSACGKVILLGEHVVVYGAPALAAGIDRGARAEATELSAGEPSRLLLGGDAIPSDATSTDARARAFAALLAEGGASPPVQVEASSDLPSGGGLGSSSALGVAIARAVVALAEQSSGSPAPSGAALARANAWERVFHGNPSGVDIAAAATGGCLRFSREQGIRPLHLRRPIHLCIGWSGSSSSTREMVEGVARLKARKPEIVERAIAGVGALVENAALALETGDLPGLGRLMDLNQMILAGLMLSTEAIEALCSLARGAGALGAKLTGAGGGGSVLALVEGDAAAAPVLAAWSEAGYSGFSTCIHAPEPAA